MVQDSILLALKDGEADIRRHLASQFSLGYDDVEDVIQQTRIRLWETESPTDVVLNPGAYLTAIASHIALKLLESRSAEIRKKTKLAQAMKNERTAGRHRSFDEQKLARRLGAVADTTSERRDVYILRVICELDERDTARLLAVPLKSISSALSRARMMPCRYR